MKHIILICISLLLVGCFGNKSPIGQTKNDNKKAYNEVMRIKADCSSCADSKGSSLIINGTEYSSDIAIKCCIAQSRIDTSTAIKKVYIHRIIDERDASSGIKFVSKNGTTALQTKERLEGLFYAFLAYELKNRAIEVVDSQTSPYTYRLDFAFTAYEGFYSQNAQALSAIMQGKLGVKNINKTRVLNINTKQEVRKFKADDLDDFNLYIHLLVKQMANKVAEEISKL